MKTLLTLVVVIISNSFLIAQQDPFPFGKSITLRELEMKTYDKDTSANALIIKEFGSASIDSDNDHNLIFKYHVKIKILRKDGLERANVSIPLYRDVRKDQFISMRAVTYNLENGSLKETKMSSKDAFLENLNKYWDVKKFTLPNVKVGSVIEYEYEVSRAYFATNFQPWEFQADIPKLYTEYWATIPANYSYNIALKGLLPLHKNEAEAIKTCWSPGGGNFSDCARFKWAMVDVPAFTVEEYMTSKKNFLSSVRFELLQLEYFDGRKDRVTKEWKDAEIELRSSENFGSQIRKGDGVVDEHIKSVIGNETDPLVKAQKIYEFIRGWYRWDEVYSKYSEFGIKKAFEKKEGNVGDINLSLIAALRYAGLDTEPMILSTRDNGVPTDLFPVLSEFNYVIAKLNLNDKVYLLDATDDFVLFGLLPNRCLNGRGRVLADKGSYWFDIKPTERAKVISNLNLTLNANGLLTGTIQSTYIGYKAADLRRKIYSFNGADEYMKDKKNKWSKMEVKSYSYENLDNFSKPLVEKLTIEAEAFDLASSTHFLFNPFLLERWESNPFKSEQRIYPVDFAAPIDETIILNLDLPEGLDIEELPKNLALSLPNNGGRYILDVKKNNKRVTVSNSLLINRTVFSSEEYHYLKELFNHVVKTHNTDLLFVKK